ncbi:hypothetical protein SAJA_03850 [Salinisphaera japonica YTM-1]|uniref:Uncharacterized protein n=1 Tax=Salinisphaera japonica YTM-1 TaxID=1209778 RepID=A0A423PZF1_9GAMM|nr:hypothetical protein SAJA_03850 [Salinisphaera japonica YTM-1]
MRGRRAARLPRLLATPRMSQHDRPLYGNLSDRRSRRVARPCALRNNTLVRQRLPAVITA